MTCRSIPTLVEGTPATLQVARTAAVVAVRFEARLDGAVPRPPLPVPAWSEAVLVSR